MEVLTIYHLDFTMFIECTKFEGIWGKAKRNVGEDKLVSKYSWSEGVKRVVKYGEEGTEEELLCGGEASAIFFDNANYPIWDEYWDWCAPSLTSFLQDEP